MAKKNKEKKQNNATPVFESSKRALIVKKIVKVAVPLLLVFILVVIIIGVATGDGHKLVFDKNGIESDRPVSATDTSKGIKGLILSDQGMTMIAENDYLILSFSNKDNLFLIKDKSTGETFRSYPEPIYETTLGENESSDINAYDTKTETGQFITSPVFVGYTKSGMDGGFVLGVNQMKHVKTVYYIENGIRLRYEMIDLELEFSVEITIEGDELVYRIPTNGIIEREGLENEQQDRRPLLASLSVLPYLGAHRSGQKGCFITPDGSGAVTYFDATRITNYSEYSKRVYGTDITFDATDLPDYNNLLLSIGAYGIVENIDENGNNINKTANSMFTSFIKEGDANATLKISNPGIRNLPFYAVYFQYNYREFYKLQINNAGAQYDMVVKDKQLGDVEQRIKISTSKEKDYSYVDVASVVREKLSAQWKERYGVERSIGSIVDAPTLSLKMFMGAKNASGGVVNQLMNMTDFDDVKAIYDELNSLGASDLRLSLLGWQRGGYFWNSTSKLKPDKSYNGDFDIEEINTWAKSEGIKLALDNNLLIVYGTPTNGATLRNSIVKKANTFYLNYRINSISGQYYYNGYYMMGPKYFEKELLSDAIKRLKDYNTTNVDLQQLGNMLYSDYNESNPLFRVQAMSKYANWLKTYGDSFEEVSIYNGNSYALPFVDNILDMPIEKSSHIVLDEEIPFLQLIYHGMINYYSSPVNNQDDAVFYMLRSIEYGSLMSFEITKEPTSELNYTYYDKLFKSQFSDLKDEIVSTYKSIEEAVKPFANLEIVDHYRVDEAYDVFCTVYSNGARVYVCYEQDGATVTDSVTNNKISFENRNYQIMQKGGE